MKFYTKEQEQQLVEIIRPMKASGMDNSQISGELNNRGLKTVMDKDWTDHNVYYFCSSRKRQLAGKTNSKAKRTIMGTMREISRGVIESIVTDPLLSNDQRVGMICAYLNA